MAVLQGKQGAVTFAAGATSNITSWSIDAACSVADGSAMANVAVDADTHWKDYVAGYKSWTASVECLADDGGIDPELAVDFIDVDGIACVFKMGVTGDGGRKYSGTGIITGISISTDKDDVIKVTYSIQGSGELAVAIDAA